MKHLAVFRGVPIPVDYASTQTYALLAKRDGGKTYTTLLFEEQLCDAGLFFVTLDPVGKHWALRAGADGSPKGGKTGVWVLGGLHGDVPLEPASGALIADVVIDHPGQYVLDVSTFDTDADQDRFALAFAQRLFRRKAKTPGFPLTLILEEAEAFIPERYNAGQAKMLGAFGRIMRQGRNHGLGMWMVAQRPQALNKGVLSQAEVLVVKQMAHPRDVDAVEAWIKANGTPEQRAEMMGALASLEQDEAYVWSPAWLRQFKRTRVPKRVTFDSSASVKGGQSARAIELVPLDVEKLGEQIAGTAERAKADDPAELRKRIRELESSQRSEPERVEVPVEVPVVDAALAREVESALNEFGSLEDHLQHVVADLAKGFSAARSRLHAALDSTTAKPARPVPRAPDSRKRVDGARPAVATPTRPAPVRSPGPVAQTNGDLQLSKPERAVLNVLGQFPQGRTKVQLAILTGYSIKSSSLDNALGRLRSVGLVSAAGRIPIQITEQGSEYAEGTPLPSGAALLDYWLSQLGKPERAVLMALRDALPDELDKSEIAEITGYSPTSSSLDNALGRLRSLQLVSGFRVAEELL